MMTMPKKGCGKVEEITIDWPVRRWTFSHSKNLDYAIALLQENLAEMREPVIGYYTFSSLGNVDKLHKIMPLKKAKNIARFEESFEYKNLEELLKFRQEIEAGKYMLENCLVIGLNSAYRKSQNHYQGNKIGGRKKCEKSY